MKKSELFNLRDADGFIVLSDLGDSIKDLQGYSLVLEMLRNRFDQGTVDLSAFFHLFKEISFYIDQKVGEIDHAYRLISDFAFDDIPIAGSDSVFHGVVA